MEEPKIILLVSGKRKSGKDFICEKLKSIIGEERCEIIRISGPLKKLYAQQHNLNLQELMGVGPYKEKYRLKMINWSDEVRGKNPGYFCEAACREASVKPVWIVSDVRRKTDISWFRGVYAKKVKTVRILADTDVRKIRGWQFTEGVDDIASECNLDDFENWDIQVNNNNTEDSENAVKKLAVLTEHVL